MAAATHGATVRFGGPSPCEGASSPQAVQAAWLRGETGPDDVDIEGPDMGDLLDDPAQPEQQPRSFFQKTGSRSSMKRRSKNQLSHLLQAQLHLHLHLHQHRQCQL